MEDDILGYLATAALLAAAVMILGLVPIALTACIPFGVYLAWKNSPDRKETLSKKHTWELYEELKARTETCADVDVIYDQYIEDIWDDFYPQIKKIGLSLWRTEGYGRHIPEPPIACDTIDGARYRDSINRLVNTETALAHTAMIVATVLKYQSFSEELAKEIIGIITMREGGTASFPVTEKVLDENYNLSDDLLTIFDGTVLESLKHYARPLEIPDELRPSHHLIVATSGSGKTTCFEQMIVKDLLEEDASIIFIDSQGDFINDLATKIPTERLVYLNPKTCPPALNLFAEKEGEDEINKAIELFEYIFSSLEAEMTATQSNVYKFVSHLLMIMPKSSIHTMLEVMEPKGCLKYQKYIDTLDNVSQSFFTEFNKAAGSYTGTKKQILNRLYMILNTKAFRVMLGANESKLDIGKAMDSGKVILISTNKSSLTGTGAALLGRIYIGKILQAALAREAQKKVDRKRTYLYIDEFKDYAQDSHIFHDLFDQCRKYNVCLIIAFHQFSQLTPKLRETVTGNTAIRFARGLGTMDKRLVADCLNTDYDFIHSQPVGSFACYLKDKGTGSYLVKKDALDKLPEVDSLENICELMNEKYGITPVENVAPINAGDKTYTPEDMPVGKVAHPKTDDEIEQGDW